MKNAALFLMIFCASLMAQELNYSDVVKQDRPVLRSVCAADQDERFMFYMEPINASQNITGIISRAKNGVVSVGAPFFDGQAFITLRVHNGADPTDLQAPLTIEAWVNPAARTPGTGIILGKEYSWKVGIAPDGSLKSAFELQNGADWSWQGQGEIPLNVWSHIVVTYDGKTVRHFLNGWEIYSYPLAGPILLSRQPFCIGARGGDDLARTGFFKGSICCLALYPKELNGDAVWAHYQAGVETTIKAEQTKIDGLLKLRKNGGLVSQPEVDMEDAIQKLAEKKAAFEIQKKAFVENKRRK